MTYTIIETADLTEAMVNVCQQDSMDTVRKSVDQLTAVLKWQGDTPALFEGVTTYTHAGIIEIMNTPAWTEESDE
jgi:hypothetical protein